MSQTRQRDVQAELDRMPFVRMFWLIGVPLATAAVPLIAFWTDLLDDWSDGKTLAIDVVPLIGLLPTVAYKLVAPLPTRLSPFVPHLLCSIALIVVTIQAANVVDGDGLEGIPILLIAVFLPLPAGIGGLVSYAWVTERRSSSVR